jgi:uncharacterized SAM-binding protein YcdF (DUF218 family)
LAKNTRRRWIIVLLTVALLLLALVSFHRPLLTAWGEWLLAEDPPQKSDVALVLSGEDGDGSRTRKGVELYKNGWVKKLVLSGARASFGHYETDFSAPVALSLGVPPKDLMVITSRARSTREEAQAVIPELERAGVHSVIVVTSNYHSSRARRIFKSVCGERVRILASPMDSDWFRPDSWWQTREGRKYFLLETTKFWTAYFE